MLPHCLQASPVPLVYPVSINARQHQLKEYDLDVSVPEQNKLPSFHLHSDLLLYLANHKKDTLH